jgi:hypothetical protein
VSYILNLHLLLHRGLLLGSINANRGGTFGLLAAAPAYGFTAIDQAAADRATITGVPLSSFVATGAAALGVAETGTGPDLAGDLIACVGNSFAVSAESADLINDWWACVSSSLDKLLE